MVFTIGFPLATKFSIFPSFASYLGLNKVVHVLTTKIFSFYRLAKCSLIIRGKFVFKIIPQSPDACWFPLAENFSNTNCLQTCKLVCGERTIYLTEAMPNTTQTMPLNEARVTIFKCLPFDGKSMNLAIWRGSRMPHHRFKFRREWGNKENCRMLPVRVTWDLTSAWLIRKGIWIH